MGGFRHINCKLVYGSWEMFGSFAEVRGVDVVCTSHAEDGCNLAKGSSLSTREGRAGSILGLSVCLALNSETAGSDEQASLGLHFQSSKCTFKTT